MADRDAKGAAATMAKALVAHFGGLAHEVATIQWREANSATDVARWAEVIDKIDARKPPYSEQSQRNDARNGAPEHSGAGARGKGADPC